MNDRTTDSFISFKTQTLPTILHVASLVRLGWMLPQNNIQQTTLSLRIIMILLCIGLNVQAQPTSNIEQPKAPITPGQLPEAGLSGFSGGAGVDWGDGIGVHDVITKWVNQGEVPAVDPLVELPTQLVKNFGGMRVTLRWMGKTFGIGQSLKLVNEQNKDTNADLLHHARVATYTAIAMLKARLPQWAKLALSERPEIMVDVQIAKCATQLKPLPRKQKVNVLSLFSPGSQGLIYQTQDRKSAWTWPGTTLSQNLSPKGAVKSMLLELGRKPSLEIALLDEIHPIMMYRFEVIHIVQPSSEMSAIKLERGMRILQPVLEQKQITDATWLMTQNLIHRHREDGHVAKTYAPSASRYSIEDASLPTQAMTAYAISQQMMFALKTRLEWDGYSKAASTLRNSMTYMLSQLNDYVIRRDPQAAAWVLLTLIAEPTLADLKNNRDDLAVALAGIQQADGCFTHRRPDRNGVFTTRKVTRFDQAVIHHALLNQYNQTRAKELLPILEASAKVLNTVAPKQSLMAIATLFAIADLHQKLELDFLSPMDQDVVIKQTRALLLNHQITQKPGMGAADVVGGFDLARQSPNIAPAPDWRSAYGVSLLASILKDPDLRPSLAKELGLSQTELLLRSALAARFIVQLTFAPADCFYGDSPVDCIGGVRHAPWDNTLNLRATTASLLSLQQFNNAVMQSLSHEN